MTKAVLLSIRPQYCELIASGEKTIEVRKTRPKLDTPFKCYIYETQGKCAVPQFVDEDGHYDYKGRGQVIGEFVCDRVINIDCDSVAPFDKDLELYIDKQCCLTREQLWQYTNGMCAYGFHISMLRFYDKPKELCEFHKLCTPQCNFSEECGGSNALECLFGLTRPPQSWCYVEGLT